MSETLYTPLPDRAVIRVSGPDRVSFLQGLVSNDIEKITADHSGYGALLTPQGKFLFDFFIYQQDQDSLLIDCERGEDGARAAEFYKKLRMYKLRAKVELTDVTESYDVITVFGDGALTALNLPDTAGATAPLADGIKAVDPRLSLMGARVLLPKNELTQMAAIGATESDADTYHQRRVTLGPAPETGTAIMNGDKEAGIIRSIHGNGGLALIRLERIGNDAELTAGDAKITVHVPDWVKLPEPAA